jgi:hypothetical protein
VFEGEAASLMGRKLLWDNLHMDRRAHPYRDTDVVDSRAPRTSQGVIGVLTLVAVATDQAWLLGVLALQLLMGLVIGRRWCLPCLFYFEVVQPRFGEGPLEDARPPRFANMIGFAFLTSATVLIYLGAETVGWLLASLVAILALLAAMSGLCLGCEAYKLTARLRGVAAGHIARIDPQDLNLADHPAGEDASRTVVHFTHPLCSECLEWERRLESEDRPHVTVDVKDHPELARKYGIAVVPPVVAVGPDGGVVERLAP